MFLFKCLLLLELALVEDDKNEEVEDVEEDDNNGGKVRLIGIGEGIVDAAEIVGVGGDEST